MCLLCVEIAKGRMTSKEIARALTEMTVSEEHAPEVLKNLQDSGKLEEVSDEIWDLATAEYKGMEDEG